MNTEAAPPFDKLMRFKNLLGLDEAALDAIGAYRVAIAAHGEAFTQEFFRYLEGIPEARIYLEHQRYPGHLQTAWCNWFELLFKEGFSERFLLYQWKSGLRHVEVGVDHRIITLGYSYLRQFCQAVIKTAAQPEDTIALLGVVDKIVDLCVLVETQAFVEATTQCDVEMIRGISHQVRNPLTVIGGNVARLQRKALPDDPARATYDTLMKESKRLEAMVNDASVYSEMFQKDTAFSKIDLSSLIRRIVDDLRAVHAADGVQVTVNLDPGASQVLGDTEDVSVMFFNLLRNAMEAADPERPVVTVSSRRWKMEPSFVEVDIFNTGRPLDKAEITDLFQPFNSPKPYGTGMGLSIARLAARKSLGDILLEPVPDEGVRTLVRLPAVTKASTA